MAQRILAGGRPQIDLVAWGGRAQPAYIGDESAWVQWRGGAAYTYWVMEDPPPRIQVAMSARTGADRMCYLSPPLSAQDGHHVRLLFRYGILIGGRWWGCLPGAPGQWAAFRWKEAPPPPNGSFPAVPCEEIPANIRRLMR